ncbi:pectin lyase-like protein [Xylariomycetidae sp. FL2044]|nr:pectin lyase-like protein [Xylariomycetidae sp. FL2044]
MKTATAFLALGLSALTEAKPVLRRADASEAASVGYATENGGTTGGAGGESTTVTTLEDLQACAEQDGAAICIVSGTIEGDEAVRVSNDKTILGADSNAILKGVGFKVFGDSDERVRNIIIRNLSIDKVLADTGDAIGIQYAENVWVDHCDVQGDFTQDDKDLYDGLVDVTHGSDYITITNNFLHNHWKASLIGHSDSNGDEDTGHLTVTYANNYFYDLNSRGPSFRFGTGHIFNNYYEQMGDAINSRLGAELLVEGNVFVDVDKPLYAVDDDGYAVSVDNDFGDAENTAPEGSVSVPYEYTLLDSSEVKAAVVGTAGATLTF